MADRRSFLQIASGTILAGGLASHALPSAEMSSKYQTAKALIRRIRLKTACQLGQLKTFYEEKLGLKSVIKENQLRIEAGESEIIFVYDADSKTNPFYHFAFNIPENKIRLAHDWQAERTELIPTPESMKDSGYPDTVRHFRNWNAHSVFFYDPAGNILEHIARHDLDNSADGPFTPKDILCISEIAFVSNDVPKLAKEIHDQFGLQQYKSASENFHFLGDENGLIIIFKEGRSTGTGDNNSFEIFQTHADLRKTVELQHVELPYSLRTT